DASPREIGDVQQSIDAAQIDERAVIGDVLDDALDDRAFGERRQKLFALLAQALFEHRAPGDDDVVPLAIELDDLEFEMLVFVRRCVLDRTNVDERSWQKRADAVDHHGQPALHLVGHETGYDRALLHRGFEVMPRLEALRLVARQSRCAVAVFDRFDRNGDEIAGLDFDFAGFVLEFLDRNERFRLESRIDDDDVEIDADDFSGDELALPHFLAGQRLLEQGGEIFGRGGRGGGLCCGCHTGLVPFETVDRRMMREPYFSPATGWSMNIRLSAPAKARSRRRSLLHRHLFL